ncbi:MAG: hypothetical protein HC857_14210 [Synechococcales cyanobacterium RU_4_20]|nr:hypothetical protein [Synechococcales cyanobacterium RU_4_20]
MDVKDLKFDEDVMQSLEDLRISREHKLAAIVQAEGRKQVAIEEAESRRAAAIAEAQGLMEAVKILSHNSEVESEKNSTPGHHQVFGCPALRGRQPKNWREPQCQDFVYGSQQTFGGFG